jgi:heavy metal efflux system protein
MLNRIIDFHLEHRWFVLVGVIAIIAAGLWAMLDVPVDAFPDLTNNQVVVITECPAMPPVEVEQLVSFPIETSLMGLPRTEGIRSISKLGLSIVTVVFDDSVNTYFARQLVNERLQEVRNRLPQGHRADAGSGGDGVRRGLSVHARRHRLLGNGPEDHSRVADQEPTTDGCGRE